MSWSFRAVFLLPGQESRHRSQKGPGETFEASPSSFPQRDAVADDLKIILKMECLEKIMSTIRKLFSVLVNLCQGLFNWKAKGLIFDLNPIGKYIGHKNTSFNIRVRLKTLGLFKKVFLFSSNLPLETAQ